MADAVLTVAVIDVDESRRNRTHTCALIFSTGDYPSGGFTMDLTEVTNLDNLPAAKFGRNPTGYRVENMVDGFVFEIEPGTDLTNWKLHIFDSSDTELTGALPTGIANDQFGRIAFFAPKNL